MSLKIPARPKRKFVSGDLVIDSWKKTGIKFYFSVNYVKELTDFIKKELKKLN